MKTTIISVIFYIVVNNVEKQSDFYKYQGCNQNNVEYTVFSNIKYNKGDTIYYSLRK